MSNLLTITLTFKNLNILPAHLAKKYSSSLTISRSKKVAKEWKDEVAKVIEQSFSQLDKHQQLSCKVKYQSFDAKTKLSIIQLTVAGQSYLLECDTKIIE